MQGRLRIMQVPSPALSSMFLASHTLPFTVTDLLPPELSAVPHHIRTAQVQPLSTGCPWEVSAVTTRSMHVLTTVPLLLFARELRSVSTLALVAPMRTGTFRIAKSSSNQCLGQPRCSINVDERICILTVATCTNMCVKSRGAMSCDGTQLSARLSA